MNHIFVLIFAEGKQEKAIFYAEKVLHLVLECRNYIASLIVTLNAFAEMVWVY